MSDGKLRFDTKISLDGFKLGCTKIKAMASQTFDKVRSLGRGSFNDLKKEASQNLDVIGKGFEKTGAKMSNFITKPALIAAGALAGITLKKGFDRLQSIDTAKAKLEGLGHSAESIDGIMDSALTSVRGTMYGLGDAATTAASAVASGIKPGKYLTRYLSLVADTASIAGTDMGEMGAVFNKVAANGKMSAEELNMLTDRGVPALQLLADATGKTVEEVRKDMEAGKIDVETFLTAMEQGFGGAAQIMGAKSFTAAAANIGASLGRIGANFLDAGGKGGGFFSQMKPLMADMLEWLEKVEGKSVEWGESFGAAFAKGIEWFKAAPKPLLATAAALTVGAGPALKLAGSFLKAQAAVKNFRAANEGTRLAVGVLRGELTASQAIMSTISGKFSSAAKGVKTFATAHIKAAGSTAVSTAATVKDTAAKRLNGIASSTAAKKVLAFASAHKIAMVASLGLIGGLIALGVYMTKTGKSGEEVAAQITAFSDSIVLMINQFSEQLPTIIESLTPAMTTAILALIGTFPTLIPALTQAGITLFMVLVDSIPQIIPPLVAALPQIVNAIVGAFPTLIPALINGGVQLFTALIQSIPEALPQIIAALPTIIVAIVQGLISIGGALINCGVQLLQMLWQGISSWAGSLKSKVVGLAKSLPGRIKSGLGSLVGIGRDFIAGLWTGIKARFDSVINSVKGLIGKLPKAVKKVLGIASPSKVMAAIGKWIPAGLVKGIESKTRTLLGAARSQMSKLQSVYDDGIGGGFGIDHNYPHPQPRVINIPKTTPVTTTAPNQTIVNQTVNINQPVSSPIETGRALKKQAMFGLAGV